MCYTHKVSTDRYDRLDDLLMRIRNARQRPSWRRRLLRGSAYGLRIGDLRTLRSVERLSSRGTSPTVGDIAEDVGVEHSTASRGITQAVRAGLLAKSGADGDRRRIHLALTGAGAQALSETTQRRREMVIEALGDWNAHDLDLVITLLERLAQNFENDVKP
jgi:DNA-binding MarR family transcriptional regulator